ncbi:hypothetical protein KUTeg_015472 [Tegillarca granosa]|uniref:Uncharacterized protein n=1 Tax=Tegillarca granosa TaxID=220873 RepID=A0ABQ9EQ85_TEGGR|nr:hypothetical protein KUTeg_015472 [Tegillarca granosa]
MKEQRRIELQSEIHNAVRNSQSDLLKSLTTMLDARLPDNFQRQSGKENLRTSYGWKAAEEFSSNPLAENSDDEKKKRKAQDRAEKKILEQVMDRKRKLRQSATTQPDSAQSTTIAQRSGKCFKFGMAGHWRKDCVLEMKESTHEKSNWVPVQVLTWLGFQWNMIEENHMEKLRNSIKNLITCYGNGQVMFKVKLLASVVGQIISNKTVFGEEVSLRSRHLYDCIIYKAGWNAKVILSEKGGKRIEVLVI